MGQKLSIKDLQVNNKKVLLRADFNVPLDKDGRINDDTRINATIPSIKHILGQGGSVILMSHLGRPKGKVVPELSLKPCAKRLSTLLGKEVLMAPDSVGSEVKKMVDALKSGEILLLENLRFYPGEEHPEKFPEFVNQLAGLGDCYVNDAFGTAHRAHASTTALAYLFPKKAAAGYLLEKEIKFIGETLKHPKRPFYAILGGAKLSSKLGVIETLLKKADAVFIGGAMAFTLMKAKGLSIGNSLYEEDFLEKAKELLDSEALRSSRLILPQDFVIADNVSGEGDIQVIDSLSGIPAGFCGVDIGPKTIQHFCNDLQDAATVLWNGPLGIFEVAAFSGGTMAVANALANLDAITIVGGGDSVAALQASGLAGQITHLSTGGGATLEYIEFGTLPGIEALSDKEGGNDAQL